MSRIAAAFARRKAFIPYLTAGDPDLEMTRSLVHALAEASADVIELGVPFSDPIADGPVNQRAADRALSGGATTAGVLDLVRSLRDEGLEVPIVLFSYLNPLLALGEGLGERLADADVDGVLVVDLPVEEAEEHEAGLARAGVDRIYLAAPSTSVERLRAMGRLGSGFVYCVARYGVTGEQATLPEGLEERVRRTRSIVGRPAAVGFGISGPEQAAAVAAIADGVVVGSALVRLVEAHGRDARGPVSELATALADAVHGA